MRRLDVLWLHYINSAMQAYRSEALHTFSILNILQARLNNTQVSLFTLALNDGDSNTIWHNSVYSLQTAFSPWSAVCSVQ